MLKLATFDKSLIVITRKRRPTVASVVHFVRSQVLRNYTERVHLCLQHVCRDAACRAGSSRQRQLILFYISQRPVTTDSGLTTPIFVGVCYTIHRYRASTSMYSLTFRVRVMLP